MHATPLDALAGIAAGVVLTLLAVCGLIWRLASWHAHLDGRLDNLEERVWHLEQLAGSQAPGRHRARRYGPRRSPI